jgi:hypothetical protein
MTCAAIALCRKFLAGYCPVYDRLTVSAGWDDDDRVKGSHFERDFILWGVRWYVAYPISYRQIEEMMGERGVEVDHSTFHRWVLKYVPSLETSLLAHKRPVGGSWRLGCDLCEGQRCVEVPVSRGRQGRRHGGLPVDSHAGS